jgi:hypothetical protein
MLEFELADRLDPILNGGLTTRRAQAVATALAAHPDPYGKPAHAYCMHSAHEGRIVKRLPGYQRWLLENTEWVPVSDDPAGQRLRRPAEAWVDIPARDSWLVLPRARLRKEVRSRFDLASAQRPRSESLARALDILADAHDADRPMADDRRRTALWLQERLDRALQRSARPIDTPWLLCRENRKWGWATDPLVADIPGLEGLDGLALLPPGEWRGLRAAFGLRRASDAVEIKLRTGKRVRSIGLLSPESRAQILALLLRHGVDAEQAARRLALIRTRPVTALILDLSLNGSSATFPRDFHLAVTRTRQRRLKAAELYYVPSQQLNMPSLGRELAALLEEEGLGSSIALVLLDAEQALADEGIREDDVIEAARLLGAARRRARIADEPEDEADDVADDASEAPAPADEDIVSDASQPAATHADDKPPVTASSATPAGEGSPVGDSRAASDSRRNGGTGTAEHDGKKLVSEDASFGSPRTGRRREAPVRGRRSVRLNGSPARGGGYLEADPETEARAMELVARYGREILGAEVFDVHEEKKGWDLEFKLPDGQWQYIEVKGTSGDRSFPLTRNERRAASDADVGASYLLYWVANIGTPNRAEIRRFNKIGFHLTEDVLDPLQWEVVDWSALPYDIVPLREPAMSTGDVPSR